MYDTNFKPSSKYSNATKAFVEAAINTYEESIKKEKPARYKTKYQDTAGMVLEHTVYKDNVHNRYISFVESVKNALVTEALYKVFAESTSNRIKEDSANRSIMRSIVSQYVNENGYDNILHRMKTGSVVLSGMYNTITESAKAILEEVNKDDPNTFTITSDMKDEFFKQLDYSDSKAISDAINARVTDAMDDFITANTKDHEDITNALKQAQEKIDNMPKEDVELKESYQMTAKQKVTKIRNAPKSVLHSMISSMCESVLKHQDTMAEFMEEGHLNIDKIVDRTSIMYTFMEMLNTSRIDTINESFIEGVIENLKK